jgi:hypothetical protein
MLDAADGSSARKTGARARFGCPSGHLPEDAAEIGGHAIGSLDGSAGRRRTGVDVDRLEGRESHV